MRDRLTSFALRVRERVASIRRSSVEWLRRWTSLRRRDVASFWRAVKRVRAELLTAAALLTGWASLTYGLSLVIWPSLAPAVWPVSIGVLLLSACGWDFLFTLARAGLYVSTRKGNG